MKFPTWKQVIAWIKVPWHLALILSIPSGIPWAFTSRFNFFIWSFIVSINTTLVFMVDISKTLKKIAVLDNNNLQGLYAIYQELRANHEELSKSFVAGFSGLSNLINNKNDFRDSETLLRENNDLVQLAIAILQDMRFGRESSEDK